MTGVAGLAVIEVATDFFVFFIHFRLLVRVAIDTGELQHGGTAVAFGTVEFRVWSFFDREGVVELGLGPAHVIRQVAALAVRGKARRQVVRILGRVVLRRVAAEAIPGQVVALAVTDLAIEIVVSTLEREDVVVIEARAQPIVGLVAVAAGAVGSETCLLVRRVRRSLVLRQVAIDAVGGGPRVSVDVTLSAIGELMTPQQGEEGVVVEARAQPAGRLVAVTSDAVRRKARGRVIGIRRLVVVRSMAVDAARGCSGVTTIDVTLDAIGDPMPSQ